MAFDLGLAASTLDSTAFVLTADYLRPWINALSGEMHAVLQLGRTSLGQFSLYQPLDLRHRWFVEPGAQLMRSTEDIYVGSDAATRYNFDSGYVYLEGGRVIGTSAELRLGLRSGFQGAERDIAAPDLPNIDNEGYGGLTAGITFDDRDRDSLATRGWLGRVRYYRALEGLGSETEYDKIEGIGAEGDAGVRRPAAVPGQRRCHVRRRAAALRVFHGGRPAQLSKSSERQGRVIDYDEAGSMEEKKKEGYF